jgi:hypothetical protein
VSEQIAAGSVVAGTDGPLGVVRSLALSPSSLEATWIVLGVLDSQHQTAVPTASASVDQAGAVVVPFSRDQLLAAPSVAVAVDPALADELYSALGLR